MDKATAIEVMGREIASNTKRGYDDFLALFPQIDFGALFPIEYTILQTRLGKINRVFVKTPNCGGALTARSNAVMTFLSDIGVVEWLNSPDTR